MVMLSKLIEIVRGTQPIIFKREKLAVAEKEGHANIVTNVDIEVQNYLKKMLAELIPEAAFIGEEQVNQTLGSGFSWIVDPIDGTTNFYREWEFSAVSVALLKDKAPIMACIYQPYKNEIFTAQKDVGAFLNNQRIYVSNTQFEHALVGFGTAPYYGNLAESGMKLALAFLKKAGDLRRTGSAALDLAYLACGKQDIFFELNLSPWDVAAGALLVEEAGGVFKMPLCDSVQFEKPAAVLATNQICAEQAFRLFNEIISGF